MKCVRNAANVCVLAVLFSSCVLAVERPAHSTKHGTSQKQTVINDVYPGLTSGSLMYARLAQLPEGTLLRTENLTIHDKDIMAEVANAPVEMREKLKKNAFFLLEQIATYKVLLLTAKTEANKSDEGISKLSDEEMIQAYLKSLVGKVNISEQEVADFYNSNKPTFGGATLTQLKPQIRQFLLQQKQQEFVNKHIQSTGRRISIEISASWLKKYEALARDNPVDKVRESGKASLVDFGSVGCVSCDMMAPILDTLREKYKGRLNVLFVHVGEEPILASRYGVQSIPVQILFDSSGKELFRHEGFIPEEEIEKQLSKMGVK